MGDETDFTGCGDTLTSRSPLEQLQHAVHNRAGGKGPRPPSQGYRIAEVESNASHNSRQGDYVDHSKAPSGDTKPARKVGALTPKSPGGEDGHHGGSAAKPGVD